MAAVWVLGGPNLSRLGTREPEIYGSETLADIEAWLREAFPSLELTFRQTDDEAELIGWLHEATDAGADVVLNPAAFTHYSYALRDACAIVTGAGLRLIEVHLSNPASREEFRHTSVVSGVATGVIQGFGRDSYFLALTELTHNR
jgi:3-dehydroquinate dehydratase-2